LSLEPLLDTNVFVHAATTYAYSAECRDLLVAIQEGRRFARLELQVLHELTYVIPRYVKQMTRRDAANLFLFVLGWPGIIADKPFLTSVMTRWRDTPTLSFTDAYLNERAFVDGCAVYTKNVREFRAQGTIVPDPLTVPSEG
jgi:predicted nucleic acid-binding protein